MTTHTMADVRERIAACGPNSVLDLRGWEIEGDLNLCGVRCWAVLLDCAEIGGDVWIGGAEIGGCSIGEIEADHAAILDLAPDEVSALRAALVEGRIDGSCYKGACCCLVGTLTAAGASGLPRDSGRPAERWYMMIAPGHVPARNGAASLAVAWIDRWAERRALAAGGPDV